MYHHLLIFVCAVLLLISGQAAAQPALKTGHPSTYTVQPGDTLWDIAGRFLQQPWRWREIWQANPDLKNPNKLYPGDVLSLSYVNGSPRIIRERRGRPTVKLSPQIRVEQLDLSIPTIPLARIQQFLSRPQILEDEGLDNFPYVGFIADEHVVGGAGDRIYVKGTEEYEANDYLLVVPGPVYTDPDDGEFLGREANYLGEASMLVPGEVATMVLVKTRQEIVAGTRLIPADRDPMVRDFVPEEPQWPVRGRIIAVLNGVTQIGQYNVVVLNRGSREDLRPGHVLAIYQEGMEVPDPMGKTREDVIKLPDERAGLLMVFRAFERVSYALVLQADRALHVFDQVRNP